MQTNPDFLVICHTIVPQNDTVSVLKDYSESTGIPSNKWQFLRGSIVNTKLKAETYMTNFRPNAEGTDFYHSSYAALLDKDQQIRGFYNILVKEDVQRLYKNIDNLLN